MTEGSQPTKSCRPAEEYERIAAATAAEGLVVQDVDGRVLWCNGSFADLAGLSPEILVGSLPTQRHLPWIFEAQSQWQKVLRSKSSQQSCFAQSSWSGILPNGKRLCGDIATSLWSASTGEKAFVSTCRDQTAAVEAYLKLKSQNAKLQRLAFQDGLTGVANYSSLQSLLKKRRRNHSLSELAVLTIDLDCFKALNDTHGHQAGDAALARTGKILRYFFGADDLIARSGGDEFTVIAPQITSIGELTTISEKVRDALGAPFRWTNKRLNYTVSIGAAIVSKDSANIDELLLHADIALYDAKRRGGNRLVVFDDDLSKERGKHQQRLNDLRDCIARDGLGFVFQPVVSAVSGEISGLETLVRWVHPRDGQIETELLLADARELGLLVELDKAAVRAAIDMKARTVEAGFAEIRMGFNASMNALCSDDYVSYVIKEIRLSGFPPDHFVVEILESVVLSGRVGDPSSNIGRLAEFGLDVVLDDFGVGYAGLAHFASLPLYGVKLDRALIGKVVSSPKAALIVATLIELCQKLNLGVVVEGIEDCPTAELVVEFGARFLQGYWLCRPMDSDAALRVLVSNSDATARDMIQRLSKLKHSTP